MVHLLWEMICLTWIHVSFSDMFFTITLFLQGHKILGTLYLVPFTSVCLVALDIYQILVFSNFSV
jgi:hypothetical protein